MTCLIDLNLFYIIIEIFNIKSLVTSIIPELFWFVSFLVGSLLMVDDVYYTLIKPLMFLYNNFQNDM